MQTGQKQGKAHGKL